MSRSCRAAGSVTTFLCVVFVREFCELDCQVSHQSFECFQILRFWRLSLKINALHITTLCRHIWSLSLHSGWTDCWNKLSVSDLCQFVLLWHTETLHSSCSVVTIFCDFIGRLCSCSSWCWYSVRGKCVPDVCRQAWYRCDISLTSGQEVNYRHRRSNLSVMFLHQHRRSVQSSCQHFVSFW